MIGYKSEFFTVVELFKRDDRGRRLWKCVCKCGSIRIKKTYELVNNHPRSCGCLEQRRRGNKNKHDYHTKHGLANKHPLYRCWKNIKQRCNNPNNPDYKTYGKRGIMVSPEWQNDSGAFIKWGLASGWKKGLVIDRIDPSKDYSPENSRFITASENSKKVFLDNPALNRGSNHRDATINEEIVLKIKLDLRDGMKQVQVSNKYGISRNMAYQIAANKTWKHVII